MLQQILLLVLTLLKAASVMPLEVFPLQKDAEKVDKTSLLITKTVHIPLDNVKEASSTKSPERTTGKIAPFKSNELDSDTLIRGVWVFVGLSLLFFVYVAIQTYRKRNRRIAVVTKYGVRTNRTDIEMEPLNDEDEDTLFDLSSLNNR